MGVKPKGTQAMLTERESVVYVLSTVTKSLRDLVTALNEHGDDTILAWDTGLAASYINGKVHIVGIAYATAYERGHPRTVANGNGVHTRMVKRSEAIKAYLPQVCSLLETTHEALTKL